MNARFHFTFDALCDRLAKDFSHVPEAEGMAAIEAAASAVREEMKAEAGIGPATASAKVGKAVGPLDPRLRGDDSLTGDSCQAEKT